MANFRSLTVTSAPSVNVSVNGADVKYLNIVNKHSAIIWVKFYDLDIATFQDTPFRTYQIAANGSLTLGSIASIDTQFSTSNGLCVRATTGSGDNDNTAPGSLPIIELNYNY